MVEAVEPGGHLTRTRRLPGGLATATHAVDITTRGGATRQLVVKRFMRGAESAPLEWERLAFAQRVALPVPEPVALDAAGDWFGGPALVMTRLEGRASLKRIDIGALADALAVVHDTDLRDAADAVISPHLIDRWRPLEGVPLSPLLRAATEVVRRELPRAPRHFVFNHNDFHPGNVVWARRRLTGVVDWSMARLGPPTSEVAYCRTELHLLHGRGAADSFVAAYRAATGRDLDDLPLWDLVCNLTARQWCHTWLITYHELGRADLTLRQLRARTTAALRRALAQL